MKSAVGSGASATASAVSIVTGVILALFTIVGGVSAVTPGANPASASQDIVTYDAP